MPIGNRPSDFLRILRIVKRVFRWERKKGKGFPLNAVIGGVGFTGETLYIGRCRLRGSEFSYVSGYIDSITEVLSVPYAGKEVKKENNYEILVSDKQENLIWKRYVTNESYRPVFSANNLLIGRTCTKMTEGKHYNNGWIPYAALNFPSTKNFSEFDNKVPGKIDLQHECFYTAFQSKEFSFREYEVLTVNIDPPSLAATSIRVLETHLDIDEKKSLEEMLPHYFPEAKPRREIESFIIGHGCIVDSISFNDLPSTKVGGSGGGLTRIELEPGENIVQVKADRVRKMFANQKYRHF